MKLRELDLRSTALTLEALSEQLRQIRLDLGSEARALLEDDDRASAVALLGCEERAQAILEDLHILERRLTAAAEASAG